MVAFIEPPLIEEVPAQPKTDDAAVERIVRNKETRLRATACIGMTVHHEEACLLQVEVGVRVHDRVVAYLNAVGVFLHDKLS